MRVLDSASAELSQRGFAWLRAEASAIAVSL